MKNAIIGFLVAAVLVGGGFLYFGQAVQVQAPSAGSFVGPDITSPYISVGGVQYWSSSISMKKATTTCSFKSPGATSTIAVLQWKISSSSSSATIVEVGTATTPFATTTLIGTTYNVGAGAQASVSASTTPTTGPIVIGPNTFVNIKIGGPATNYPVGTCDAEFDVI